MENVNLRTELEKLENKLLEYVERIENSRDTIRTTMDLAEKILKTTNQIKFIKELS